jgi:hypothetical protein
LPYFVGAYDNATYKGRIWFTPPWQTTGSFGPPLNKTVVADHWAKWTFHLFVDVETNKPVLFSSPYGGVATYGNWSEPDELWPKDFNGGWTNLPARDSCFDPTMKAETCKDYIKPATTATTTTTTPKPKHGQEFLLGFLQAIISDQPDTESCVLDGVSIVSSFSEALGYIKKHSIGPALEALSDAFGTIRPLIEQCQVAKTEVMKLLDGLKGLTPAVAEANIKAHHSDILKNVAEASSCLDKEDYSGMGVQVGSLVRKIIEVDAVVV